MTNQEIIQNCASYDFVGGNPDECSPKDAEVFIKIWRKECLQDEDGPQERAIVKAIDTLGIEEAAKIYRKAYLACVDESYEEDENELDSL